MNVSRGWWLLVRIDFSIFLLYGIPTTMPDAKTKTSPNISVVVPLYNEEGSVRELHARLLGVLRSIARPFEIIFVDDGSSDATFSRVHALAPLTVIRFRRNYGQTAALAAGIAEASGGIIVTLDGDLENDPADIPTLLEKLAGGYDIVSGWRQERWRDRPLSRRIPSRLANSFISWVTGITLHDHGCQLKAYRGDVLKTLNLSGDMHRMIAAHAASQGARVAEVPVRFESRKYGRSKYGFLRVFRVLLDVLAFHFFQKFSTRPMHFFGVAGFVMAFLGALSFIGMIILRLTRGTSFISTPLPTLTVFFVIVAVQFILMGLLAELMYRLMRNEKSAPEYQVAEVVRNG